MTQRPPELKVKINDEEYSVVSLSETAHTLLHDPAADGVTKGMANAVMALCDKVEALHRDNDNLTLAGSLAMKRAESAEREERLRAESQAQAWREVKALQDELEALDDALCNALSAAQEGLYDQLTVEEHLEVLIERVRNEKLVPPPRVTPDA